MPAWEPSSHERPPPPFDARAAQPDQRRQRVRLLWRQDDDRVVVAVDDAKTSDSFVLNVKREESAMDVFHHPYAYAAWHGIATCSAVPALT
jgi:hypothetical protein